jgi:putative membrane protein
VKIIALIRSELKRLTATSLARLALVALMVVPLLYGGMYLWANQNPYAKLDHIPAAIVDNDSGAKDADGHAVNYGNKVTKQLVDAKDFDWHVVSQKQADKGIRDETYNFVFTIPSTFSTDLTSTSSQDPQRAKIDLTTNDTTSYLSSTIADQAGTTIRSAVTEEVGKQAAATLLVGLNDIRSQLQTAASGSQQLVTGSQQLESGLGTARSGASSLDSGLQTLRSQTAALPSQTQQLATGASGVADGNKTLNAAVTENVTAANQALSELPAALNAAATQQQAALNAAYAQAGLSHYQQHVLNGIIADANKATQATATQQATALSTQLTTLQGNTQKLQDASAQVAAGAAQLSASAPALTSGIAQASSGASTLSTGIGKLDSGAAALVSGSTKLTSGLNDGVKQIPATTADTRDKQASAIANPVAIHDGSVASAGSYGAGLAPFFISLAAWIGMYALFLIIKPISKRAITAVKAPARITLAGWLTPAVLGLVQMLALFAIVKFALNFDVVNPAGMISIMVLASVTFAAIIMALNVWLGSVGQFLGLVLMLIQLVTAGGTFPWQTLPAPLAALHHALPMSYAVDAIRQLMYGGSTGAAWADAGVLGCWLVGALLFSYIAASRMTRSRTMRDLRPSLIG